MRYRGAVEPEPFRGLGEVTPHHVLELAEVHDHAGIEGSTQEWAQSRNLFPAQTPSLASYDEAVLA
jgi:hypothetical protein